MKSQTHTHIARWAETAGSRTTGATRLLRPFAIIPDSPKETEQNHDACLKYRTYQSRYVIYLTRTGN